jgi:disks large-associated protein 5
MSTFHWKGETMVTPETSQDLAPEKACSKTRSVRMVLSEQWKQLLQKYKEEKQLQKLKELLLGLCPGVVYPGLLVVLCPIF